MIVRTAPKCRGSLGQTILVVEQLAVVDGAGRFFQAPGTVASDFQQAARGAGRLPGLDACFWRLSLHAATTTKANAPRLTRSFDGTERRPSNSILISHPEP